MLKNSNQKKSIIINCDTGIDDAVALLLALKSGKVDIKLIVTDVGNVSTKQAAQNTLNVLELFGSEDIPVCAGEGKCLVQERNRIVVHGKTGLGEYVFDEIDRKPIKGDAVEKMYQTIIENEQKTTLVCMSPSTNIAKLIIKHPEVKEKIERLIYMAGSIEELGENEIPYTEYNVSCDPEAAEVVFNSGIKIDLVPMEMGHTAYLEWQDVFETKNENYTGSVLEIIFRSYKDRHVKNGIATHDGCAIAYLTNPEIFKTRPVYGEVKYFDKIGTGVLTVNFNQKPNMTTCTEVDVKKFRKLYFKALRKCK